MRVTTDERRPYRQTEPILATKGSPNGGNTQGDRVPVVAQRPGQCPGHGQGGQVPALHSTGGVRMDKKALLGLEAPCRHALSLICVGLGLESRMPRNGARPVREGAVGFPL